MPTPFESALLNLKLFELRREPVLREAREWFLREFNPETLAELAALATGERNASFRMVLGYWDMAASMVTSGGIDGDARFLRPTGRYLRLSARFIHFCRRCARGPASLSSANTSRRL